MAKKFGKFLLFTAAVGSAAAAVYYYMQKKEAVSTVPEDEDYDDFSEDLDEDAEVSRNYVPLTPEDKAAGESKKEDSAFTPLEQVAKPVEEAAAKAEETVEEFFDEEETSDEEPPINDN
ncbi:MAG: hypothetical protein ACI4AB_04550 [Acetatifactor sp.]